MTFAGDSAFATNVARSSVVVDDVDLLAAELGGDGAHALAELADAGALGVDAGLVRAHGDLGAVAGLAGERDDLDERREAISGTSRANSLRTSPGCVRETVIDGPFVPFATLVT